MAEDEPANQSVSLWASKIPILGLLADHHWLVVDDKGIFTRWEVWQKPDMNCLRTGQSWGHLHKDLMAPEQGVQGGPAHKLDEWHGDTASMLVERMNSSPEHYPWCYLYRYWPGPNSNTYVQWVLTGVCDLNRRGWGKRYCQLTDTPLA